MASEESFINEVTEEVRREKLYRYVRRYGWIAAILVVALVGGAAWNEYRKAEARASAQARGDAILAAVESDSARDRATALAAIPAEGRAAAVLAMLAAAQVDDEPTARAAALDRLDALAADPSLAPHYRDLAALKAVLMRANGLLPEERIERLAPLTLPGAPYRTLALEATAHAHVAAGDTDAALAVLTDLLSDAEASQGLRQRASQLIVALGGSVEAG